MSRVLLMQFSQKPLKGCGQRGLEQLPWYILHAQVWHGVISNGEQGHAAESIKITVLVIVKCLAPSWCLINVSAFSGPALAPCHSLPLDPLVDGSPKNQTPRKGEKAAGRVSHAFKTPSESLQVWSPWGWWSGRL
jgi:hypothetical protein